MTHPSSKTHATRATQGGAVKSALLIILASILLLIGIFFVLMCAIIVVDDGDPEGLFTLLVAIPNLAGGIALIVLQQRDSAASAGKDTPEGAKGNKATDPDDGEVVVASQPLTGHSDPHTQAEPTPARGDTAEDVASLVFRSDDVYATLRDLVRHASSEGSSDKRHLASMLEAAGLMAWQDAPTSRAGRLSRTHSYWIRTDVSTLDASTYDTLLSVEAALNLNQDLPKVRSLEVADTTARSAVLALMRQAASQQVELEGLCAEGLAAAYPGQDEAHRTGEWAVRSSMCASIEHAHMPFRIVYDLRCNVAEGLVVLGLELPRPRCMAIVCTGEGDQVGLARAYALRLATLLAREAFSASEGVQRVVVNGHEHDAQETILSLDFDRDTLSAMSDVVAEQLIEEAFPTDDSIRARFDDAGWFAPIEPFVSLGSDEAYPAHARVLPELDTREASPAVMRTTGARRICDLGINEHAGRIAAWETLRHTLGTTTEQAVSALVETRNQAEDITVVEACSRTIDALVSGDIEPDDTEALARLFVGGSALDAAVARASELLDDTGGTPDPEKAVEVLTAALAPIDDMGAYLDDSDSVYRYFGSVSERVHHNLTVDEGGRQVVLVPDAYFNAHSHISVALGMLERNDEALAHADVCRRLAPTSTYAAMRKVRVLEAQSRIYEAADLIIAALRDATTPQDASICHYRLAYMEWKLGREDLGVACYQRSLAWDTDMSEQAREELDDLLDASPDLHRLTDDEACDLLAREGIPLGCTKIDRQRTLAAAVACMDDGALISASPLVASLFADSNDDVVMGVYRSLNVSS